MSSNLRTPADHKLTPQQIAEFREAFALFDHDGNNTISAQEISRVFKSIGQDATDEQINDILNEYDVDKNGEMDFDEFLQMMIAKTKDSVDEKELQKQVKAAFKMFDVDGNGKIDVVELQTGMDKLGEHLTQDQAQDMMLEADKDGDGFIDEEEFAATIFQF